MQNSHLFLQFGKPTWFSPTGAKPKHGFQQPVQNRNAKSIIEPQKSFPISIKSGLERHEPR